MATKGIGLEFDVLAGSAGYLLPALQAGCSGGINGLAGALGKHVCDLYTLASQHKWNEALKVHLQITRIDTLGLPTFENHEEGALYLTSHVTLKEEEARFVPPTPVKEGRGNTPLFPD
ncbi:4-hydroxy-2-oxoglutarate aldolase, mitochondrial [Homalodisca vitripennis]|nr:4-hydroxy-2-oxoglutarate aldolase, mitochondrial [Homalodisca vitripennis]